MSECAKDRKTPRYHSFHATHSFSQSSWKWCYNLLFNLPPTLHLKLQHIHRTQVLLTGEFVWFIMRKKFPPGGNETTETLFFQTGRGRRKGRKRCNLCYSSAWSIPSVTFVIFVEPRGQKGVRMLVLLLVVIPH